MARALIVGCGCRGRELAAALAADGHAVRGTTRDPARAAAIAAAGAEPWVGDPDRLATLTRALDNVTVVVWLLASARGAPADVSVLHAERLRAYLREMVDTTVRGFAYEAVGTADSEMLARGRAIVAEMCRRWKLPYCLMEADPGDVDRWACVSKQAVTGLLSS